MEPADKDLNVGQRPARYARAAPPATIPRMTAESRYAGVSAFERLEAAGLRADFDAAAHSRSRSEMVRLLGEVEWAEASWFVDTIIANPRRYGY